MTVTLINEIAKCKMIEHGNIMAWDLKKIDSFGHKSISINLSSVCWPPEKRIFINRPKYINSARTFCKVHDGYLWTPTSSKENQDALQLMKEHNTTCQFRIWLGIERDENSTWINPRDNRDIHFAVFEKGEQLWDSPYLTMRGTWKTHIKMNLGNRLI